MISGLVLVVVAIVILVTNSLNPKREPLPSWLPYILGLTGAFLVIAQFVLVTRTDPSIREGRNIETMLNVKQGDIVRFTDWGPCLVLRAWPEGTVANLFMRCGAYVEQERTVTTSAVATNFIATSPPSSDDYNIWAGQIARTAVEVPAKPTK